MAVWNDPNGVYSQNQAEANRRAEIERRSQEAIHQRNHDNLVREARSHGPSPTPTVARKSPSKQASRSTAAPKPDNAAAQHERPAPPVRDPRTPAQRARAFEDGLAMLIMLAVWAGVSWAGIAEARSNGAEVQSRWYVFVIIGFISGAAVAWALRNPLRPILVLFRRLIVFAFYAGLTAGALYVGYRMFA